MKKGGPRKKAAPYSIRVTATESKAPSQNRLGDLSRQARVLTPARESGRRYGVEMMRRPMSKKLRFEVFKRDGFVCQYCGAAPPGAVLEIDHIDPVSSGGGDEEGNLVTACFDCNRGKAARDLSVAPEALSARAARIAEAEEQLAGYREIMRRRDERKEDDAWEVVTALEGVAKTRTVRLNTVIRFLERMPLHEVLDAARVAMRTKPYSDPQRFKYFCGVCWRKIERAESGADKGAES